MALRADEFVSLKGKSYPLYKGVLREAIENGLERLEVEVLQFPLPENGGSAVCRATATFVGGDGVTRVFSEIGDCDGVNCGPAIAPHKLRMSATRAKGRALRDALGVGEALIEEMGGRDEEAPMQQSTRPVYVAEPPREKPEPGARPSDAPRGGAPVTASEGTQQVCADCGCSLTRGQVTMSTKFWGQPLCITDQKKHPRLEEAAA